MDCNGVFGLQANANAGQPTYANQDSRYIGHPIGILPSETAAPYPSQPQLNPLPSFAAQQTRFYPSQHSGLSRFESSLPLYCADWLASNGTDFIALSTFKESINNKLHILTGKQREIESLVREEWLATSSSPQKANPAAMLNLSPFQNSRFPSTTDAPLSPGNSFATSPRDNRSMNSRGEVITTKVSAGFELQPVTELNVDYPVTKLQWDPQLSNSSGPARLATSLDVLRLYKLEHLPHETLHAPPQLLQTHVLVNTSTTGSPSLSSFEQPSLVNVFPPVTSFDWNKVNTNTIITSSVDTTCTVWDLNRSLPVMGLDELLSAVIKTQLIAHDSEVFDVKFLNNSLETFASVGNDGLMRVFDLRALEHSTIIYEPPHLPVRPVRAQGAAAAFKSNALIKLDVSGANQNYLATVGANSNQVLIIDMRMPGVPIAVLDGSLGGRNLTPINLIQWHPSTNHILTGGDDCAAQVWDCNRLLLMQSTSADVQISTTSLQSSQIIDLPILAHEEKLEVNAACWCRGFDDWIGVVSGKGFQAVHL